jgi:hypothetical protein
MKSDSGLPPQNLPRLLTRQQLAKVRRLWREGVRRDEICRQVGITQHVLEARRRDQLANLRPRKRGQGGSRFGVDPTEEEIWGRLTAEIQATWTEEERQAAWEGSRRQLDEET